MRAESASPVTRLAQRQPVGRLAFRKRSYSVLLEGYEHFQRFSSPPSGVEGLLRCGDWKAVRYQSIGADPARAEEFVSEARIARPARVRRHKAHFAEVKFAQVQPRCHTGGCRRKETRRARVADVCERLVDNF